jgi:hypothetical protein
MSSHERDFAYDSQALGYDTISLKEAFWAMSDFVWRFGQRAGDDLLTLIGDVSMRDDKFGGPFDQAAWSDWLDSVDRIRRGIPPQSDE